MSELNQYIGKIFVDDVSDAIQKWADENGYTVNVIIADVDNIDVDDNRLNVWTEFTTGKIHKFTIG